MKLSKSQLRRIIREQVDAVDVRLDANLVYDHLRQVLVDNGGEEMSALDFEDFEKALAIAMRNLKAELLKPGQSASKKSAPDYREASFSLRGFMPSDEPGILNKFYDLKRAKDRVGLVDFLKLHGDEGRLQRVANSNDATFEGLADYLLMGR